MLYYFLKVDKKETQVDYRGFDCASENIQRHLEKIGSSFLDGYHAMLKNRNLKKFESLNKAEAVYQGFIYEGAAMGLVLSDFFHFKGKAFLNYTKTPLGEKYIYLLYVGAGWALARLPFKSGIEKKIKQYDPLLKWLAIDGYGFHEAYFHTKKTIYNRVEPRHLSEYARAVFYQGVGRCLWFVKGAQVHKIVQVIESFPTKYQGSLWSGIGLAAAYAGGATEVELIKLSKASNAYKYHLAQGAAFAAKARIKSMTLLSSTELVCQVLCKMNAKKAAEITDLAIQDLVHYDDEEKYQLWRTLTQTRIKDYKNTLEKIAFH